MLDVADEELTEEMIKEFHKILKEGTSDSRKDWFNVGDYKKLANEAGNMKTALPKNVQKYMAKLIQWYTSLGKITIEDIIEFHYRFECIHPFQDGNGRTGRMILFRESLKYDELKPFIILDDDRSKYLEGLKEYREHHKVDQLLELMQKEAETYYQECQYFIS